MTIARESVNILHLQVTTIITVEHYESPKSNVLPGPWDREGKALRVMPCGLFSISLRDISIHSL